MTKFFFFRQNKKRGVHYTSTPRFAETKSSNFLLHVVFFQIYKRRTLPRIEISKAHIFTPHRVNTPKGITNGIATLKTAAMPFVHKSASYRAAVFFTALQDLAVKDYIARFASLCFYNNSLVCDTMFSAQSPNVFSNVANGPE